MAQAGSTMKTNWRLKILVDCPFKQSFFCSNVYSLCVYFWKISSKLYISCFGEIYLLYKFSKNYWRRTLKAGYFLVFKHETKDSRKCSHFFFFFQRSRRISETLFLSTKNPGNLHVKFLFEIFQRKRIFLQYFNK